MVEPRTLALGTVFGLHGLAAVAGIIFGLGDLGAWIRTTAYGAIAVMLVDYGYERFYLEETDECPCPWCEEPAWRHEEAD